MSLVQSLGNVFSACTQANVIAELVYLWDNADVPDSPEAIAVAAACENVFDDLIVVLENRGWTVFPSPPGPERVTGKDISYLGSWKLKSRKGWEYATNLEVCWVPDRGLLLSNKGGTVGYVDFGGLPPSLDPNAAHTVDWSGALFDVSTAAKGLTVNAGTLGGLAYLPGADRLWAGLYEFYNTAGRDNLGLISFAPDLSGGVKGAWRTGPASDSWTCPEITGLNCSRWVDPATLKVFHANKCHEWVVTIPSSWSEKYAPGMLLASGRQRPAGAFGGAQGPALYAFVGDEARGPGHHQDGTPLIAYPTGSRTFQPGYWNAQGDDSGTGCAWVETKSGKRGVLFCWSAPLGGGNWYGQPGPPCNAEKGWHSKVASTGAWPEWAPLLHLYDDADLGAVMLGDLAPWQVQPAETVDLSGDIWMPNPGQGCEGPFVTGLAWDGEGEVLYGVQPKAGGVATQAVVHAWKVS